MFTTGSRKGEVQQTRRSSGLPLAHGSLVACGQTLSTEARDDQVIRLCTEAMGPGQLVHQRLQFRTLHPHELATGAAVKMMVRATNGQKLVAALAIPQIDGGDETELPEEFQGSVDRGNVYRRASSVDSGVDLVNACMSIYVV